MSAKTSGQPLFDGRDWDLDTLARIDEAVAEIAIGEMGLEIYPNSFRVIGSKDMLANYAMVGVPLYPHWSFGKDSLEYEDLYRKGRMGLALEMVINSSPCVSYLMEENTATLQTLVIAHAAYGHNHFFKNNYIFKEGFDAGGIMPYLEHARRYIAKCEERHGEDAVETLLDAGHALRAQSVARHEATRKTDLKEERKRIEKALQAERDYNDLWAHTVSASKKDPEALLEKARRNRLRLPEENILYFLEKNAPRLETWQKEILRIVRVVAQYFYPQEQTKVMNEGCATYVHYKIMHRLLEKGQISEGSFLEFLQSHTNVVFQPDFDDPRFDPRAGLNPYAIGFGIMSDIERIVTDPTDEDRAWFPKIAGTGDVMGVLRDVWANYRDESFIRQFLSPHLIRKWRMFCFEDDPMRKEGILIKDIHDERGYRNLRKNLADSYDDGQKRPAIKIVDADLLGSRVLKLEHIIHEGALLEPKDLGRVMRHLANLWGYDVVLCEIDANSTIIQEHKASPG